MLANSAQVLLVTENWDSISKPTSLWKRKRGILRCIATNLGMVLFHRLKENGGELQVLNSKQEFVVFIASCAGPTTDGEMTIRRSPPVVSHRQNNTLLGTKQHKLFTRCLGRRCRLCKHGEES